MQVIHYWYSQVNNLSLFAAPNERHLEFHLSAKEMVQNGSTLGTNSPTRLLWLLLMSEMVENGTAGTK